MPLNKYVISVFNTVALLGLCLSVNAYADSSDGGTCPAYGKITAHFDGSPLDPVDTVVFFDVIQIPRRIEVVTNQKTVVNNSDQGIKNIFFDYAKANVGKFGVKSVNLDGVFVGGHVFNTTSSQPPTGPCYKSVKQVEDERNRDIQKFQRASSAENLGWVKHVIIHHGYWYQAAKPSKDVCADATGPIVDKGNGVLIQCPSKLEWTKSDSGSRMLWPDAKQYCTSKGSGWDLPSVAELRSLTDKTLPPVRCDTHPDDDSYRYREFCSMPASFHLSQNDYWTNEEGDRGGHFEVLLNTGNLGQKNDTGHRDSLFDALCVRHP